MPSNVVFDIINSVKGGSGKSTIALNLAAYCVKVLDSAAYIIDLDLRGTSWEANFSSIFDPSWNRNSHLYIHADDPEQSLLYNSEEISENAFCHISLPDDESKRIHLCICDPQAKGEIDDPRADFLLSAVYRLIKHICDKETGTVHIIFDMPPSYERHAERVIEKLLLDKNSSLIEYFKNESIDYSINMLMIYALSQAHLEQNVVYVKNFFKKPDYSSLLNSIFMQDDEENIIKLKVFFVGNNIKNFLNDNIITAIMSLLSTEFPEDTYKSVCRKTVIIPQMAKMENIELLKWFDNESSDNQKDAFKSMIKDFEHEIRKDENGFLPYFMPENKSGES